MVRADVAGRLGARRSEPLVWRLSALLVAGGTDAFPALTGVVWAEPRLVSVTLGVSVGSLLAALVGAVGEPAPHDAGACEGDPQAAQSQQQRCA